MARPKKVVAEAVVLVENRIAADKVKRDASGVVETEAETTAREEVDAKELTVARGGAVGVTDEDIEAKVHTDTRDKRVATHKANVETARLARVELEKTGVTETEGAKLDREAKEASDLTTASILYAHEPIDTLLTNFGGSDFNLIAAKVNEIVEVVNARSCSEANTVGHTFTYPGYTK